MLLHLFNFGFSQKDISAIKSSKIYLDKALWFKEMPQYNYIVFIIILKNLDILI